ncbi:MAG: STT3 domain-containing protein [Candidatus Altiarchaeota archaeon]
MARKRAKKTDRQNSSSRTESEGQEDEEDEYSPSSKGRGEWFMDPMFVLPAFVFLLTLMNVFLTAQRDFVQPAIVALSGIFGAASIYFIFVHRKKKSYQAIYIAIPIAILITTIFLYHSYTFEQLTPERTLQRDFSILAVFFGILSLLVGFSGQQKISLTNTLVIGIFFGTLITHLTPYPYPFLSALDPYWFYKWSQETYSTGYLPEYDYMVYPYKGGILNHEEYLMNNPDAIYDGAGLQYYASGFFAPLINTLFAFLLEPLNFLLESPGLGLYETAILYPGVISAFTVLLIYLLVKDLFHEQEPYNRVAGILASFFLAFSPAFSTRAVAGNAEEDSIGMFFLVASFYLFARAMHKRNLRSALLAGLGFFTLTLTWSGFRYIIMVVGLSSAIYSLVNALQKRFSAWHTPYVFLSIFPVFLIGLVLHERGTIPELFLPAGELVLFSFLGGTFVPIIIEAIRQMLDKTRDSTEGEDLPNGAERFIYQNVIKISLVCLIILVAALMIKGPESVFARFYEAAVLTKTQGVVGKTIAEQNPLAGDFSGFLQQGYGRFGLALYYGLLMIIPLAYISYKNRSFGAIAVLCWSVPMMWGVFNKSQFLFVSSASIAVLGASIGLLSAVKKEDLDSLRIIGFCLIIFAPIAYLPFFGGWNFNKFVGVTPMHMGPGWDRSYWEPALNWFSQNTDANEAILTWWDYGHWLTSVSHRPVLIDNLQADQSQIQDVAQFFVNKTTEDEAFEIVKIYNKAYQDWRNVTLRYATIDWSMIGKGSALHFIATGVIEDGTEGSFKNYAQCGFAPEASSLSPQMVMREDGNFHSVRKVVFGCSGYIGVVVFEVATDDAGRVVLSKIIVREVFRDPASGKTFLGAEIPWEAWAAENDASLLGVQHPRDILTCALSSGQPDQPVACRIPTFNTLIYTPGEFSDFMMTKLYLGQYLDAYKDMGLYNREITPLKHFELVWDGLGQDGNFGTVKIWRIIYDDELEPEEPEPIEVSPDIVEDFFTPIN